MAVTLGEGERQGDGLGVGEGQEVLVGRQHGQLLEALAGAPDGEVVALVVGLQHTTPEPSEVYPPTSYQNQPPPLRSAAVLLRPLCSTAARQ